MNVTSSTKTNTQFGIKNLISLSIRIITLIPNTSMVLLLKVAIQKNIDNNFTLEEHINHLCQKLARKLHALSQIPQCLSQHKKRNFFKIFITSQLNYCPKVEFK